MLKNVVVKNLITHCDDRGYFREILRCDDNLLKKFGQSSATLTYPGVIKAFHYHKKQDDLWYVAAGMAQVVLYDLRENSPTFGKTQVIYAGEENPVLIFIPAGVAHGYRVIGTKPVLLIYHSSEPYNRENPDEMRLPFDDPSIGFNWTTKNR
ncbi:MAG: dTDP-4-dehydrorhamnose 3,5-epimerase family protein [Candidatus Woesearchaeota archaeon]